MGTTSVKAHLLGVPQFSRDGHAVPVPPSSASVFAYVLLKCGHQVPRTRLLDVVSDGVSEMTARRRLNTAVWRLRCSLETDGAPRESIVVSTGQGLAIAPDCDTWVDVSLFEASCRVDHPVRTWSEADADAVRSGLALYGGGFLEGVYDDWALAERARLSDLYLESLLRLAQWHELRDEADEALHYARLAAGTNPLREDLQRQVMRLYRLVGLPEMAAHHYEVCREVLRNELGTEPLPETREAAGLAGPRAVGSRSLSGLAGPVREALTELESAREELRAISGRIDDSIAALRGQLESPRREAGSSPHS